MLLSAPRTTRCASRSFLSNTVAQPTIASLYFQSVKIRRRVLAFQMLLVSCTRQHVVCVRAVRAARACILCRTALFCTQMHAVNGIFPLIFPLQLLHLK